ncbi:MAG: tetratricopeptide repeat protein [Verrucomicrobiota bacterium]|jgi:tetratricopeptide (TPR) repeat protein
MSWNLKLAIDILWLTIILGFGTWLFIRSLKRSENPPKLIFKWVVTMLVVACYVCVDIPWVRDGGPLAAAGIFMAVVLGIILVIAWGNSIITSIARPLTNIIDGGNEPPEPKPYYSIAISKRKLNRPLEAIVEIRKQLAKFPNDFEGVMLLAGVQAEDLKDLPGAEITLNHFCDWPEAPSKQVSAAMNQLADWQLKLAQDADAARAALEKIIARFPDTELSLQAAQRIAHLGGTGQTFLAAHGGQPVAVPEGVKNVGLLASSKFLEPAETEPGKLAAAYVKHLEQHPLDTEVREKLAIIYADHYQRLDLATGELKQMIEYPNQPVKRVAHWLNLLADLQIRHGADYDTVRETLEKIIGQFSDLAVAELARARLAHLKLEFKGQKETPTKQVGVYEQNIGLKPGSLRRQL